MTTIALVESDNARPRIVRITGAAPRAVMARILDTWEEHGHRARVRHNGRNIILTRYADDGTVTRRITLTKKTP